MKYRKKKGRQQEEQRRATKRRKEKRNRKMPGQWKDEKEHGGSKNAAGGVWSGEAQQSIEPETSGLATKRKR